VWELRALAQVDGDCDSFRAVLVGQPRHGHRRVESARVRKNDSIHAQLPFPHTGMGGHRARAYFRTISFRRVSMAAAASTPRHTRRIVSSPAMVPATSTS